MAGDIENFKTPPDPKEPKWWPRVTMFKVGLEICAIVVAAIWAGWNFWEFVRPAGANLAEFGSTLEWSNRTPTECEVDYTVNFHNLSKRRLKVAKIRVRAWYMDEAEQPNDAKRVTYLHPVKYDREAAFDSDRDVSPPLDRLVSDYGPTEQDTEGFTFFVKQAPGKRIIFWTELWSDDDVKKKDYLNNPTWTDNRHDWVCGTIGTTATSLTATPPMTETKAKAKTTTTTKKESARCSHCRNAPRREERSSLSQ